jgi:hypothetical protein
MRWRLTLPLVIAAGFGAWGLLHAQKPFAEYPGQWTGWPKPADWQVPHDWVWGRLRYQDFRGGGRFGRGFGRGFGRSWSVDYPRGDRHLVEGLRRLTRIDSRSVEQVIDLDNTDDVYNWPFLYAVEVGRWQLNREEAAQLRDFLNRGGFLMVDDFHGTFEWDVFVASLKLVFPDKEIEDLPDDEQIFHTVFNLDQKFQVPGNQFLYSGQTWEQDGFEARWRGVYDDKGRLLVAICHNMDLGDAVERADEPTYPEKFSSLAFRIIANYATYDLTH